MKSNITEALRECFSDLYPSEDMKNNDEFSDYKLLHHLGTWCAANFASAKAKDTIQLIGALYQEDNLFVKNAIENEFLSVLSRKAVSNDLCAQIVTMPKSLRSAYIKTLLENQKP